MLVCAGCDQESAENAGGDWQAQVDTIGDTIVVRTLGGSEWATAELVPELRIGALDGAEHEIFGDVTGMAVDAESNIYIYDGQVPALRKYGREGEYLGTFGRQGGGPGEYERSDGGLAVLADGRIVLRDPGNGRFTVYTPDGEYLEDWPARGGMFTSTPLFSAADGGFYNSIFGDVTGVVRHAPDGTAGDTLPLPERQVEGATVTAQMEGSRQTWSVPFSATALWTFHPDGHYLSAVSSEYAIDLLRRDSPVLRLAMDAEPVPVRSEERAAEERRVTEAMRGLDPAWRWNGPPIPSRKPLLRAVRAGEDGRIWVQLHQPGERVPDDELAPRPDGRPPAPRFREPTLFHVFESDGGFLGPVAAPTGFSASPPPVMRGENVWATERDPLGVEYVVRYRVAIRGAEDDS